MQKLFTPKVLRIPYAIAAKYFIPGTHKYEELVSEANLILVQAARSFDPTKNKAGYEGWPVFAYGAVSRKIRTAIHLVNGKTYRGTDKATTRFLVGDYIDSFDHVKFSDDRDLVEFVMSLLTEKQRAKTEERMSIVADIFFPKTVVRRIHKTLYRGEKCP